MPRYMIERNMPGAGAMADDQIKMLAQENCDLLEELGPHIEWVETFITENKLYCIYAAPDKSVIMQHAALLGVPANRIEEIKSVVSPATVDVAGSI